MNTKLKKNVFLIMCVSIIFIAQAVNAYAWVPMRHSHHPHHPRRAVRLPSSHTTILVAGLPYYYYGGVFYRRGPSRYVIVTAPVGAVVPVLPVEYQSVVINGTTYYTYDNVYYVQSPAGYTVTPTPVVAQVPSVQTTTPSEDAYVVHVPNANGSYTPVVLKKSGEGFVGPQGEYYPKHPTVEQLKVMYAK